MSGKKDAGQPDPRQRETPHSFSQERLLAVSTITSTAFTESSSAYIAGGVSNKIRHLLIVAAVITVCVAGLAWTPSVGDATETRHADTQSTTMGSERVHTQAQGPDVNIINTQLCTNVTGGVDSPPECTEPTKTVSPTTERVHLLVQYTATNFTRVKFRFYQPDGSLYAETKTIEDWPLLSTWVWPYIGVSDTSAESHPGMWEVRMYTNGSRQLSEKFLLETGADNPAPVLRGSSPTDPDGDGLYEDVRGDGEANVLDIQTLFNNLDNLAVTSNSVAFNFHGSDSEINMLDVQALYADMY